MLPRVLTGLCLVALAALLVAEGKRSSVGKYATKPVASLAFILLAVTGGALDAEVSAYSTWVIAGLVLGAGGDIALMFQAKRAFMAGLVLFLLGHIAYIVACAQLVAPLDWGSLLAVLPVVVAIGALVYLWPHLEEMKAPVIAYLVTITLMVVAAIAVFGAEATARPGLSDGQSQMLLVGAILFFGSDLFVARERFVQPGFVNRAIGLPAYYAGQLLFAWSTVG